MAINFITVDAGRTLGAQLLGCVDALRRNEATLRELKEIMDNMTDGITYTNIETNFGIPVGKGQTMYNLVSGAVSELAADVNFTQLVDWTVPSQ